jgi:hypothetical protein
VNQQPELRLRRVLATWKQAYRRMSQRGDSDADKLARDIAQLEQGLASTRHGGGHSRMEQDHRRRAGGEET